MNNCASMAKSAVSEVILSDTYFGIIVEYFPSIEYASSLCLISKYHYEFAKNEHYNFQIISRILSREFFPIKSISSLIDTSPNNVYELIWIVHHFWMNMNNNNDINTMSKWLKRDFWSRWRYLTSNTNVELYGIKYWITSISKSQNTEISKLFNFNENISNSSFDDEKQKLHISTAMILHSNMNGQKNTFDVNKCTELMDFCVGAGYSPQMAQFRRLIICTLDINKKRDGLNHTMFAWSLNYLIDQFESNLNENRFNISVLQDWSAMITELILLVHNAKVEHKINIPSNQYEQLIMALNNYSIQERMKRIWSNMMGGNMINFTAGFSLRVSGFFNGIMGLTQ